MKIISILIALILLTASCGRTKKLVHTRIETRDSIVYKETVRVDTVKIKAAEVEGEIDFSKLNDSIENLQSFIENLNYQLLKQKVSTGSRAGVQFRVDTVAKKIYIKGTCDSTEILSLRNSIEQYKYQLENRSEKMEVVKSTGVSRWNVALYVIASLLIGCIGGILIKTFLR